MNWELVGDIVTVGWLFTTTLCMALPIAVRATGARRLKTSDFLFNLAIFFASAFWAGYIWR